MGMSLGWIAVALAGLAAEPKAGSENVPIQYKVRFVETEGMGWREAVFSRLTPVTRQGAATVWTAPEHVKERILQQALGQNQAARTMQTPLINAWNGAPVHFSIRFDRQLVTRVSWDGNDRPTEGKPESVRTGPVGTMTGRKMDQGVLVQLVLEDTEVRAIHHMNLPRNGEHASQAATSATIVQPHVVVGHVKAAGLTAIGHTAPIHEAEGHCEVGEPVRTVANTTSACCASGCASGKDEVIKAHFATTSQASTCCSTATKAASKPKSDEVHTVSIEVPEIASQAIAGEWLIPKDGILLVSFGPHTVAGKDGKAVIRERLAIIEAEGDVEKSVQRNIPVVPRLSLVPVPAAPIAERALKAVPKAPDNLPMAIPTPPSRSIPQGVHADGRPAELPQLPADEAEDSSSSEAESAEPRPSPQSKKTPQPRPQAKPTADSQMNRTGYNTTSKIPSMPSVFMLPVPNVGLQFLVPVKAVSLRLPFNRKLEIEVFGRVVRNPEPEARSAELATKSSDSEKR